MVWCAGIHGAEAESVAFAVNLIELLEHGADLLGRSHERLVSLLGHYRLIVLPCVNMDGRSISPDHLRGVPYETFRRVSQGCWLDGSLIGWRGSKEFFPLPLDRVAHPGRISEFGRGSTSCTTHVPAISGPPRRRRCCVSSSVTAPILC